MGYEIWDSHKLLKFSLFLIKTDMLGIDAMNFEAESSVCM
jgi:hypothetical protein